MITSEIAVTTEIKDKWNSARLYGFLHSLGLDTTEFMVLDIILWKGLDDIDSIHNEYGLPINTLIKVLSLLKKRLSKPEAYSHFRIVPPQVELKIKELDQLKIIIDHLVETTPSIERGENEGASPPLQNISNILKSITNSTTETLKESNLFWTTEPNFKYKHFNQNSKPIYKTQIQLDLLIGKELSQSPEYSWIKSIAVKRQELKTEKKIAIFFDIKKNSKYLNTSSKELPIKTSIGNSLRTIVLSPSETEREFVLNKDDKKELSFSSPLRHDIPLEILLRSLRREKYEDRYLLAKKFEDKFPHRIDFWLYRRLIIDRDFGELYLENGSFNFRDKISASNTVSKLLAGITTNNDYIRTSCIAIVARIRFHLLKFLFDESHAHNTLKKIAQTLEMPDTYNLLKTGAAEKKLLSILCIGTSICINNIITSPVDTKFSKAPSLLRLYKYVYSELNSLSKMMGLSQQGAMIFDSPMISSLFVDLILKERRSYSSNCIYWAGEDYLPALGFVLNNLCREKIKIDTKKICSDDYESIKEVFIHIRRFQRLAWALVYSCRKNAINARSNRVHHGALVNIGKLESDELALLSDLAFTERALGNHIDAAICSATVLFRVGNKKHQLTPQKLKKLKHISRSSGLSIPHHSLANKSFDGAVCQKDNYPKKVDLKEKNTIKPNSLADWIILHNPSVSFYLKRFSYFFDVEPTLFNITGRISNASSQPNRYSKEQRGLLFEVALSLGMVREASFIAVTRDSQTIDLKKVQLNRYANLLLEIFSKALPYIDHKIFHLMRGTILRKLWKNSTDTLTSKEILKIHEVHHGMFQPALESSEIDTSILWYLNHSNPTTIEVESYYDHIAKYIPKGFSSYLAHYNLDIKNLDISKDTAVISLSIKDGHILSCVIVSNKKIRSFEISSQNYVDDNDKSELLDWVNLIDDIVGTQEIWRGEENRTTVPWSESFRVLASNIINCINALNPTIKYINIAVSDVLRGLPWQHLFSIECNQEWLIEHISNVTLLVKNTKKSILIEKDEKTRKTIHNPNDPVYALIEDDILKNRKSMDNKVFPSHLQSVLTIFAQGDKNGTLAKLFVDNQSLSKSELDDLSGYDLTIFHSCHSGYINDSPIGSLGGLPGFFLSHDSKMVIAPVGLVKPQTAIVFDGYITTWLKTKDKTFYDMYIQAIQENTDICFYTVFGSSRDIDYKKKIS